MVVAVAVAAAAAVAVGAALHRQGRRGSGGAAAAAVAGCGGCRGRHKTCKLAVRNLCHVFAHQLGCAGSGSLGT